MVKIFREFFCLHRKFLLFNLISRSIKLKYRKSYLGLLWTALAPAFSAMIYFFVFRFVIKVQVPNYMTFILSGILAWGFFSASLTNGLESIVGNYGLVSKVPIPLNVFALNECVTLFINFLISQPILLLIMFFTNTPFTVNLLYIPLLYLFLFLQGYSLALLLAILFVYFRDLRHLLALLLQMLFYMTPIVYTMDMVPEKLIGYTYFIPHFYIFEGIHRVVAKGTPMGMMELATSATWTVGIFFSTMLIFYKTRHILAEKI